MTSKKPVFFVLITMLWGSLLCCPIIGIAANRLLTPKGQYILTNIEESHFLQLIVVNIIFTLAIILPLLIKSSIPKAYGFFVFILGSFVITYLCWFVGDYADGSIGRRARYSFGAGFWLYLLVIWLISVEVSRLTFQNVFLRLSASILFWIPTMALIQQNHFEKLSLFIEYRANSDVFDIALGEHINIVLKTLLLTITVGLTLGIYCYKHSKFGHICLNILGVLQTIPSIALFGLLMPPLTLIAKSFPWLASMGLSGIGTTPAIIALFFYSLLPMVRSTNSGLQQVSPIVLEVAKGMGMTSFQSMWQVQLRLALPVILSGLRITTVQAIGLTVVAALIGAGGFGAIMFRGLASSAIDLVLLGVIPVVIMAALADTLFKLLVHMTENRSQSVINHPQ